MRYASINDPTIVFGYATHPGKTGKNNEDDFALFEAVLTDGEPPRPVAPMQVALVADGIGGNMAGETASHLTAQTFFDTFRRLTLSPPRRRLIEAIETANLVVYERSLEEINLQGMGTTVVAAALLGNELFVAHAGDSRAYLIRSGHAFQLTTDHTWAQEAIAAGRLMPDEARAHPNRHVIKRFLGIAPDIEIDTDVLDVTASTNTPDPLLMMHKLDAAIRIQPGDVVLLCSDGLTDVVSDKQIEQTLKHYGMQLQDAANHLVELANKAGGPDNITVLILQRRDPAAPMAAATLTPSRQTPLPGLLLAAALVVLVGALGFVFWRQSNSGARSANTTQVVAVITPAVAATSTPSSTVAPPTAIPGETLSVVLADTDPPAPVDTATAELTFTATLLPTATPVAENAPVTTSTPVPKLATATPTPTATPIPTATPTATQTTAPATPAPAPPSPRATAAQPATDASPGNIPAIRVQLSLPSADTTVEGNSTFSWQPSGVLPAGYGFEPAFWVSGQNPVIDGRGWGGTTTNNALAIDLTKYPEVQSGIPYQWGVRLVQINPYEALELISEQRTITVQRPDNSEPSNPPSGGGGGDEPTPVETKRP